MTLSRRQTNKLRRLKPHGAKVVNGQVVYNEHDTHHITSMMNGIKGNYPNRF